MSSGEQGKKKPVKPKSNEEIIGGFQKLRSEQRFISSKLTEMELEHHEHKLVLGTLQGLAEDRKCFRMIGGVLCERTVKEVKPAIQGNMVQLEKVIKSLNEQLISKGKEINEYKEEYNVKIKGIDELNLSEDTKEAGESGSSGGGSGVLVS